MIPILYEADETAFTTNGLGRPQFSECTVHEVLNGEYELSAKLPSTDKHFNDIKNDMIILASVELGSQTQPFRIYDVNKSHEGYATISAEHISYRLSHIPVLPFTATSPSDAFTKIKDNSVVSNPFTFTTDVTPDEGTMKVEDPSSAKSLLGEDENQILGTFHSGEYKYDRFKVSLLERRGRDTNIYLRYGKDIATLEQDESLEDVVTAIFPYYKKTDSNNNTTFTYISGYIYEILSVSYSGNQRIEILDCSGQFDSDATPSQNDILEYAKKYAKDNNLGVPKLNLEIELAQLWHYPNYQDVAARMEKLQMGDMIHVIFPSLGVTSTGEVIEYEWNVLTDTYDSITIGNYVNDILKTIKNITRTKTFEEQKNEENKNKDKSGRVTKTASSDNEQVQLLSNKECDAILGLTIGTSNDTNTVATFTQIRGSISNFTYNNDGWYGTAATAGEFTVGYSLHYYGIEEGS